MLHSLSSSHMTTIEHKPHVVPIWKSDDKIHQENYIMAFHFRWGFVLETVQREDRILYIFCFKIDTKKEYF